MPQKLKPGQIHLAKSDEGYLEILETFARENPHPIAQARVRLARDLYPQMMAWANLEAKQGLHAEDLLRAYIDVISDMTAAIFIGSLEVDDMEKWSEKVAKRMLQVGAHAAIAKESILEKIDETRKT